MLFRYKGFDGAGNMHDGYVVADNKQDALSSLKVDRQIVALVYIKRKIDNPIVNNMRDQVSSQRQKTIQKINDMSQARKEKEIQKREKIKNGQVSTFSIEGVISGLKKGISKKLLIHKSQFAPKKDPKSKGVEYIDMDNDFGDTPDYNAEENYFLMESGKRGNPHLEDGGTIEWDELIPEEQSMEIKKNLKIKVNEKEVLLFTKKLNMMLSSGVPLIRSLTILRDSSSKKMAKIITSVITSVQKGSPLSLALSKFPRQFDSIYVSLINIGETSGSLTKALKDIVYYKEKNMRVKKKVQSASIYPSVIAVVLGIMLVIGSIYFIPMFEEMFQDQNVELPFITRLVFALADKIPLLVGGIVILVLLISILKKNSRLFDMAYKSFIDLMLFRVPVLKGVINASYMFTFASSTALMLENGIRLKDALQLTRRVMKNVYMKYQIASAIDLMIKGYSFSESISNQSHFDTLLVSVLITGEESGKMGESLREIAEYYDEELNKQISTLMEIIQPVFILLIAAIVIPVIIAVYMPIMEISSGAVMGL